MVMKLVVVLLLTVLAVDRHKFKTCEDTFCSRLRLQNATDVRASQWQVAKEAASNSLQFDLTLNEDRLVLKIVILEGETVRFSVDELQRLPPRYALKDVLMDPLPLWKGKIVVVDQQESFDIHWEGKYFLRLYKFFRMEYMEEISNHPVILVNNLNGFSMETYSEHGDEQENVDGEEENDSLKAKRKGGDDFKGSKDSQPHGPAGFSLDFVFAESKHVFGLPEHATRFALLDSFGDKAHMKNPYRLYNLDVFKYELDEPMALYGSIPFVVSHSSRSTSGIYWNSAAETFVDVFQSVGGRSVHFMTESGVLDAFLFPGPTINDVLRNYCSVVGFPQLPQLFAIGYHQCRWNYNDEQDVVAVGNGFEMHDMPYDVIWLDIEHTDGKKYFTWDKTKFPNIGRMLGELDVKGRKMVTIVDPHIKIDNGYSVYKEMKDKGFFVKESDGKDYSGWCWPGSSAYPDFSDTHVRKYWSERFLYDKYESAANLYTWNDMNEPSVFNGPEVSLAKDILHGSTEHRDIHNIYGYYVHQATFEGHLLRSKSSDRPFVLSRAFFAGSQRFGAIWTGDNTADWNHLKYSIPMLLSIGITGLPFSGADVGGFFGDPDGELLVRWYQAASFQPFF